MRSLRHTAYLTAAVLAVVMSVLVVTGGSQAASSVLRIPPSAVPEGVSELLSSGRYAEAIAPLRECLDAAPGNHAARRALARSLEGAGFGEAARAQWELVVASAPDDEEGRLALAALCGRLGDSLAAQAILVRLMRSSRTGARARLEYGILLARAGRLERAGAFLGDEGLEGADRARALYNRGLLERRLGNDEAALLAFEGAVAAASDFPAAWNNLGLAAEAVRRPARAEEAWCRALAQAPWDEAPRLNLSRFMVAAGRADEARALLEAAPAPGPAVLTALGVALGLAGRHEDALACFEVSLRGRPDDGPTLYNVAVSQWSLGRVSHARVALEAAVRAGYDGVGPLRGELEAAAVANLGATAGGCESLATHGEEVGTSGD